MNTGPICIRIPFDYSQMKPNGDFNDPGNPDAAQTRLYCSVELGGVCLHMEAIQVEEGDECPLLAINKSLQDDIDSLLGYADFGPFRTSMINGRHYVIVLTPFCE